MKAVIAAVAALSMSVSACASSTPKHGAPALSGTPLINSHWHLTGVRSASTSYTVPATYRAELTFDTHGQLSGLDGRNALSGSYRTDGENITIKVSEVGTAGGTGTIPAQEALSSIYLSTSTNEQSVTSKFDLTPSTLTLTNEAWTLTFNKDQVASSAPEHPSPTATSTST